MSIIQLFIYSIVTMFGCGILYSILYPFGGDGWLGDLLTLIGGIASLVFSVTAIILLINLSKIF